MGLYLPILKGHSEEHMANTNKLSIKAKVSGDKEEEPPGLHL